MDEPSSTTKSKKADQVYYLCRFESLYSQGTGSGYGISTNKMCLYRSVRKHLIRVLKECVDESGWQFYIYFIGEIKLDKEYPINDLLNPSWDEEITAYEDEMGDIDIKESKQNYEDIFDKYLFPDQNLEGSPVTDSLFMIKSLDDNLVFSKIPAITEDNKDFWKKLEYDSIYLLKDGEAKMFFESSVPRKHKNI